MRKISVSSLVVCYTHVPMHCIILQYIESDMRCVKWKCLPHIAASQHLWTNIPFNHELLKNIYNYISIYALRSLEYDIRADILNWIVCTVAIAFYLRDIIFTLSSIHFIMILYYYMQLYFIFVQNYRECVRDSQPIRDNVYCIVDIVFYNVFNRRVCLLTKVKAINLMIMWNCVRLYVPISAISIIDIAYMNVVFAIDVINRV